MSKIKPLVAIVGRPNVGKSTLFNRIIEDRKSIVDSEPGVTRDRVYEDAEWAGKQFSLIDTGGYMPYSDDKIDKATRTQANIAVEEADLLLFVVDVRDSITSIDREVAQILRKSNKPIFLVVNKCDNEKYLQDTYEFFELGLGEPFPVSAINGRRVGDLLDEVIEKLPVELYYEDEKRLNLAIIGKPNAGKSSLTNALLGMKKSIVTDIPGTTRDAIDTDLDYDGHEITLVDTAGLRKRKKVNDGVEFYSTVRANKSIQRCDVAVLVIDAYQGFTRQDANIVNEVIRYRKGLILAYNKWDTIDGDINTAQDYFDRTVAIYSDLKYYPFVFISAKNGKRIQNVLDLTIEIYNERQKRVKTKELNQYFEDIFSRTPPPAAKGKFIKIKYISQVHTAPPVFVFFTNFPKLIDQSYRRFIERKLRDEFGFNGVPISMKFRKK
ncbi:MAG: ribosome biogenesis GTPase Der [Candidatus Marinimicrobia bacterium]|nr:ribosome biogenesis GTPase Der [Candidatus Neomarinimicrobiota bacterium]